MPESAGNRRGFGRIAKLLGIAVVVLLLIVAALPLLIDANQFRPTLETSLSEAFGRQVKVGNLKASIFSGGVTADDLSIADDPAFSRTPFLRAKSLNVVVELVPLIFSHQLNVTGLTIDRPEVTLLQTAAGDWNFSSLGGKSKSSDAASHANLDLSVKLVKITGGRFAMGRADGNSKPLALEDVALELRDFSKSSVFPFSFSAKVAGGGQITLEGKAGPLDSTDSVLTPLEARLKVASLDLASSGVVDAATGMAGLVSFDGQGESNGRAVNVSGRLRAEKLRLVKTGAPARRPLEFDFAVAHDLRKRSGTLQRGNLHFGSAPATLTGTYALRPEATVWNLVFSGPGMAVPELAGFLPAMDVVLPAGSSLQGGTASARLAMEGPANRLVTSGSVGLSNTRLAGFNLGAKMAAIQALAGIPSGANTDIQSFSANLRMSPEGTSVEALQLIVPTIGNLTGSGTVSAGHALDFKMRTTLHTSGSIMAALGQKGDTSVPFLIGGTSSDPVFRPDVRSIATEKIENLANKSQLGKAASGLLNGLFGKKKN
jgi:AsmA protein